MKNIEDCKMTEQTCLGCSLQRIMTDKPNLTVKLYNAESYHSGTYLLRDNWRSITVHVAHVGAHP